MNRFELSRDSVTRASRDSSTTHSQNPPLNSGNRTKPLSAQALAFLETQPRRLAQRRATARACPQPQYISICITFSTRNSFRFSSSLIRMMESSNDEREREREFQRISTCPVANPEHFLQRHISRDRLSHSQTPFENSQSIPWVDAGARATPAARPPRPRPRLSHHQTLKVSTMCPRYSPRPTHRWCLLPQIVYCARGQGAAALASRPRRPARWRPTRADGTLSRAVPRRRPFISPPPPGYLDTYLE